MFGGVFGLVFTLSSAGDFFCKLLVWNVFGLRPDLWNPVFIEKREGVNFTGGETSKRQKVKTPKQEMGEQMLRWLGRGMANLRYGFIGLHTI